MMRLPDLKAQAQEHYRERLDWNDSTAFGGSAWADVDHHIVSVMVRPPAGNPHIAKIIGGKQMPLEGEQQCQKKNATIAPEAANAKNATAEGSASNVTDMGHSRTTPNAQFAMAQEIVLSVRAQDSASSAMAQEEPNAPERSTVDVVQLALTF